MYCIKFKSGFQWAATIKAARRLKKALRKQLKINAEIYKRVEDTLTGYAHFEKIGG